MKLSIVTTSYNSQEFINDTILSVLSQVIQDEFEYIISDDASSDETVEIVKKIAKEHPRGNCIELIERKKNVGVMKNFFGAVQKSSGDYIAFCDSDDVWSDPNKLLKQLEFFENNDKCAITYHRFINKVSDDLSKNLIEQFDEPVNQAVMNPQTSTMMVRGILRELVDMNVVNEAQGPQNDQYLRFLLQGKGYFKPLSSIKPNVRVVRESSIFSTVNTLTKKKKALQSWQTIYKYHGYGKNEKYLEKKVKGFQSAINWLRFQKTKSFMLFKKAAFYDLKNGLVFRKLFAKSKRVLTSPLISLRNSLKT